MMKRFVLFLPYLLFLTGCAQIFDGNLFKSVDTPTPLDANALASESDATIVTQVNSDSSFLTRLQSNAAALTAVQSVLSTAYSASGASTTTVITDAQAYIKASTGGSTAGAVVTAALSQVSNLSGGATSSSATSALKAIFSGESQAQIQANLTQFGNISGALAYMQTAATSGSTVNSTTFFGSTSSKLDLAVTAALAATVNAFMADDLGVTVTSGSTLTATQIQTASADLAAKLAAGTSLTTSTNVSNLTTALSNSSTTTTNPYAYLTAVTGVVKT